MTHYHIMVKYMGRKIDLLCLVFLPVSSVAWSGCEPPPQAGARIIGHAVIMASLQLTFKVQFVCSQVLIPTVLFNCGLQQHLKLVVYTQDRIPEEPTKRNEGGLFGHVVLLIIMIC